MKYNQYFSFILICAISFVLGGDNKLVLNERTYFTYILPVMIYFIRIKVFSVQIHLKPYNLMLVLIQPSLVSLV